MLYEVNGHLINCKNINCITKTKEDRGSYGFCLIMQDGLWFRIQHVDDLQADVPDFFDNIFYISSKEEVDSIRRMITITTK